MWLLQQRCWARLIVVCDENRSLRLALLERRGAERAAGRRVYGFSSTFRTMNGRPRARRRASAHVPRRGRGRRPSSVLGEVAPPAMRLRDRDEPRVEASGLEGAEDVPVAAATNRQRSTSARRRAAWRRTGRAPPTAAASPFPGARRDLEPVQPVEDPRPPVRRPGARRCRGLVERALDRVLRDLVEHHPPHRDLRLEHLAQVPGDRLALPVLVRREQQLVRVAQLRLQIGDDVSCPGRRRRGARSRSRRRRRACRTGRASPSARRTPDSGGRGCGRCSTRPRSPCRGSRRSSAPWRGDSTMTRRVIGRTG